MKIKSLFLLTAVLIAGYAHSAKTAGTKFASDAVMPYVQSGECPGLISVLYKQGVQETACLGWANVEKKQPMDMDKMFMQCSQTKGFCGVTIAILIEEGKISLDDPVSKYLPEFKTMYVRVKTADGKLQKVQAKNVLTIRMVMNHTGGFGFEIPSKVKKGWPGLSLRDTAREASQLPLGFEPGTRMQYSNTGIDIGAAIIEVVTGKPWEVFLKERVLDPLGMKNTTFQPTDEQLANSIAMYDVKGGQKAKFKAFNKWMPLPHNGPSVFPSAGAGLWTTANDQLKFYKMLMNQGVGENGVRILKEDTFKKFLATSTRPKHLGGYSLGLTAAVNGWMGHGGAWGTSCAFNWKTKMLRLKVVQFNGNPRPWDNELNKAADKFFKQKINNAANDAYTGRIK